MRRPRPWLWLLAWAMTVLLFRAVVVGQQNKEPVHLRSRTASPFDERWGGDFNTSESHERPFLRHDTVSPKATIAP